VINISRYCLIFTQI